MADITHHHIDILTMSMPVSPGVATDRNWVNEHVSAHFCQEAFLRLKQIRWVNLRP